MNCIDEPGAAAIPHTHVAVSIDSARERSQASASEDTRAQLLQQLQASYPVLLRWMRRKLGDHELAADMVNDAIVIALEHQRSGRLQHSDNVAGYVFKVGMNLLRNHRRKLENQPRLHLDIDAAQHASPPAPAEECDEEWLGQAVQRSLRSLSSERDRDIVQQFYLDGVDKDSLCRAFAVSSLQFNVIVSRARQRMKAMLESRGVKKIDLLCLIWYGLSAAWASLAAAVAWLAEMPA